MTYPDRVPSRARPKVRSARATGVISAVTRSSGCVVALDELQVAGDLAGRPEVVDAQHGERDRAAGTGDGGRATSVRIETFAATWPAHPASTAAPPSSTPGRRSVGDRSSLGRGQAAGGPSPPATTTRPPR